MSEFCPYTYKGFPAELDDPWTFPMPSEKERDRRWQAIKTSMRQHNLDCLIVTGPFGYMAISNNHLYYISNYVPYVNRGTYIVFPLEGEPQMAVSNVIGAQFRHCATQTSWIKEIVDSPSPARDVISKIKQLKLENGRLGIVGYRSAVFPAFVYDALRESFPGAAFEDATAALGEAMNEVTRTSEEEPVLLRKACEILDCGFDAVARALKPGVREYELWAAAEQAIVNNGGWYPHFMIVASGPSPTFLRAPASHHVLNPGDVVMFEVNSIYGGIQPQICFSLSLGRPKAEVEVMFDFCLELYRFALQELEKNRTFMQIELDLADRIHAAGYEPETPQIHRYNMASVMPMGSPPQPGDFFTVHPNLANKDYTASAKFGGTVRMTKDGKVEELHRTPAKLNIV